MTKGVTPTGPGCQPTASAADAASQSGIPNANDRRAIRHPTCHRGSPSCYCASPERSRLLELGLITEPDVAGGQFRTEGGEALFASEIEAATAGETGIGSTEGESAVPQADAQGGAA